MAAGSSVKFTRDFLRCSSRLARIQRNSKNFRRISSVSGDEVVNSGGNCLFVRNFYVVCTWFLYCLKWPKSMSTQKIWPKVCVTHPLCIKHLIAAFLFATHTSFFYDFHITKDPLPHYRMQLSLEDKKGGFPVPLGPVLRKLKFFGFILQIGWHRWCLSSLWFQRFGSLVHRCYITHLT